MRTRRGDGIVPGMLTVSALADRVGLRLDGEADLSNQDEIRKALAALPPDATVIHLELARLEFIDVAAARQLIAPTQQPPHPRLILHHPPASVQRLISLLWPDVNAEFRCSSDSRSDGEPRHYTADRGGPAAYLSISRQRLEGLDTN
jgi:hypothetical protein